LVAAISSSLFASGQNNSVMEVCGTGDGGVTGDISNYTINWVYKPTDITGGYPLVQTKFSSVPSFSFWFLILFVHVQRRLAWPRFPLLTGNQWPKPQAQVAVVYPPPNSSVVLRQRRNASHPTAHVSIQIRHTGSWYHIFTAEHPYDAI
jgi:hypothetical protein